MKTHSQYFTTVYTLIVKGLFSTTDRHCWIFYLIINMQVVKLRRKSWRPTPLRLYKYVQIRANSLHNTNSKENQTNYTSRKLFQNHFLCVCNVYFQWAIRYSFNVNCFEARVAHHKENILVQQYDVLRMTSNQFSHTWLTMWCGMGFHR